jgi:hypothetical protein
MRVMRSEVMTLAVFVMGCGGPEPSGESDASPSQHQGAHVECEQPPASCFEAWACPVILSSAPARPDPAEYSALRFRLSYEASDSEARLELVGITGAHVAQSSDGPFSPDTHSGSWAELRDDDDRILYTRGFHELVPESREVPPDEEGGSPTNIIACPEQGELLLTAFANLESATELVLFQEPIDGERTFETVELARFHLPDVAR